MRFLRQKFAFLAQFEIWSILNQVLVTSIQKMSRQLRISDLAGQNVDPKKLEKFKSKFQNRRMSSFDLIKMYVQWYEQFFLRYHAKRLFWEAIFVQICSILLHFASFCSFLRDIFFEIASEKKIKWKFRKSKTEECFQYPSGFWAALSSILCRQ